MGDGSKVLSFFLASRIKEFWTVQCVEIIVWTEVSTVLSPSFIVFIGSP